MDSVGLLAGVGRLPVEFAAAARRMGLKVFAVALLDDVDQDLHHIVKGYAKINIAKLNEIITFLKENNIKKVTMLGKVTKELLFNGQHDKIDTRMLKVLSSVPDTNDDTLMLAFVQELAEEGIEVLDQTALLKLLMPKAGILSKREPTAAEIDDIKFGFFVAKKLGGLDIGQTVVVKNKAVMALEAIEGTDACILRGGALARNGAVVVKTAKPNQDNRFDIPAVGEKTIESMLAVKASVLAIEAEKTLIVDREKVIALADDNGIAITVI